MKWFAWLRRGPPPPEKVLEARVEEQRRRTEDVLREHHETRLRLDDTEDVEIDVAKGGQDG